jgi:hypothetical protein
MRSEGYSSEARVLLGFSDADREMIRYLMLKRLTR